MSQDKSLENLFGEALERHDPVERARFLDEACGTDTVLRQRIEKLIRAHDEASGFLLDPSRKSGPLDFKETVRVDTPPSEKAGDRIGRYKLLQQIGEGGCGIVYMAEQEEPMRRRVALKVIKLGMDTKQVIARFEAERQALALMDHPNIAKVLDAGATDTGRPYFVMELIRGTRITEFCDENKLPTQERLKLFIQVCQAIQHAHQKGVIHRDIKPSNILVTVNDGVAIPKVIDFGIAKATAGRLTDHTLFTAFEQFIGTPAYMSPEQAVMTTLDIDTRSDIYGLGVLLYELLTGRPPFDQKELLEVGLDEMRRTIREKEPPKPSTRLSSLAREELTTTAQRRQTEAPKLVHLVQGDLDWIVMKCLEKDRGRRYETANGLAVDLQRHLNNEPIAARPPSRFYEFRKTVQRHKVSFIVAAVLFVMLTLGAGISTWQAIRATRAEREQSRLRLEAEQARLRESAHRQTAETAQKKSEEVARFLKDTLTAAGPIAARGRDATLLRELLDGTARRIDRELGDQPEVQGDLWTVLGYSYRDIGDTNNAILVNDRALSSYRQAFAGNHPKIALALGNLGVEQSFAGRIQQGSNNAWLGLQMARTIGDEKAVALGLARYGRSFRALGTGAEAAVPYLREAVEILGRQGTNQLLMSTLSTLADSVTNAAEAVAITQEVLRDSIQRNGEEDTFTAYQHFILGQRMLELSQAPEAEVELRKALQLWRTLFTPDQPHRPIVFRCFMYSLALQKKWQNADFEFEQEAKLCPTEADLNNIGMALKIRKGEWPIAETNLLSALESKIRPDSISFNAAIMLARTGRMDEYRRCCQELLKRADGQPNVEKAEQAAKVALLFPSDAANVTTAGKLADFAAATGGSEFSMQWVWGTKALADYRRGNFSSAIDFANRSLSGSDVWKSNETLAYCIQALAYVALGDEKKAQAALNSIPTAPDNYGAYLVYHPWELREYWGQRDWIMAYIIKREAEERLSIPK